MCSFFKERSLCTENAPFLVNIFSKTSVEAFGTYRQKFSAKNIETATKKLPRINFHVSSWEEFTHKLLRTLNSYISGPKDRTSAGPP